MANNASINSVNKRATNSPDTPRFAKKKCPYVNKNKFIHKDDLKDKCVGCDVDSITKNYPYVMKDFN